MRASFTFAHLADIPLKLNISWFFAAILVTWTLGGVYFPLEYPNWTEQAYWMVGLLTSLAFFASVLLHEIGHALVAVSEGVPVRSITLFILGGVAHIEHEPPTAGSEFRIVVAGPFTSLFLAAVFTFMARLFGWNPEISGACDYLGKLNFILAIFNMIPGFPLDGGRILRSSLWKISGEFYRATRWATYTGLGIAGLFALGGIALALTSNYLSGIWTAFIGIYLGNAAYQSYRQTREEEAEMIRLDEQEAQLAQENNKHLPAGAEAFTSFGQGLAFIRVVSRENGLSSINRYSDEERQ